MNFKNNYIKKIFFEFNMKNLKKEFEKIEI
jgi:hypothetical protein